MGLKTLFNDILNFWEETFPKKTEFYKFLEEKKNKILYSEGRKSHRDRLVMETLYAALQPVDKKLPDDQSLMKHLEKVADGIEKRTLSNREADLTFTMFDYDEEMAARDFRDFLDKAALMVTLQAPDNSAPVAAPISP